MMVRGTPGLWHIQKIILRCLCVSIVMTRQPFHRGDVWHCLRHNRAEVVIDDVMQATLAEQEELTQ